MAGLDHSENRFLGDPSACWVRTDSSIRWPVTKRMRRPVPQLILASFQYCRFIHGVFGFRGALGSSTRRRVMLRILFRGVGVCVGINWPSLHWSARSVTTWQLASQTTTYHGINMASDYDLAYFTDSLNRRPLHMLGT